MEDKIKDDKELSEKLWELRKLSLDIAEYIEKKEKSSLKNN